jgi:hypothetical protein
MSRRIAGSALSLATLFLLSAVNPILADQKPAKPGTKATLEVEFTLSGKFSESGDLGSTDWNVNRHFKAIFEIKAQELAKFGFLDQSHQVEMQPETQALGQQSQQMAVDNADMMAKAQAIADACGDDEACIEQKVWELSQDPNAQPGLNQLSSDGKAMNQSVEAWDAKSPPRYQLWKDPNDKAPKGKASASVKESLVQKTYFPICTEGEVCTMTRDRDGSQDYDTAKEAILTMTMVEVDTVKNLISLSIPWPVVMINMKEVTQDGGGKKTMPLANAQQLEMIQKHTNIIGRPIEGSYKDQSGEDSFQLPGLEDYNAPIDVKMRWRFKVL